MDYGVKAVTYDCTCTKCGAEFKFTSVGTGYPNICDKCYLELLEVVHGYEIAGRDQFGCVVFNYKGR